MYTYRVYFFNSVYTDVVSRWVSTLFILKGHRAVLGSWQSLHMIMELQVPLMT